jgi:hypothetical protein
MIEITGGKLYVCDYFMPVKSNSDFVVIAKPHDSYITVNNGSLPPERPEIQCWEFKKVITVKGDIRWEFQGHAGGFGDFINYYVQYVFERFGLEM